MLEAVGSEGVYELRPDTNCAENAESCEDKIPGDEATSQIELLAVLHEGLAAEYQHNVDEGIEKTELPVALHPVLLGHDIAVIEELGLIVEQAGVIQTGL